LGVVNELKREVKDLRKSQTDEIEAVQAKIESIDYKLSAQNQEMQTLVLSIAGKLDHVLERLDQK
jgi:hypothetical protein